MAAAERHVAVVAADLGLLAVADRFALGVDAEGHAVGSGEQTEIGGNDRYVALCRRHFMEKLREGEQRQLPLKLKRTG